MTEIWTCTDRTSAVESIAFCQQVVLYTSSINCCMQLVVIIVVIVNSIKNPKISSTEILLLLCINISNMTITVMLYQAKT